MRPDQPPRVADLAGSGDPVPEAGEAGEAEELEDVDMAIK